MGEITWCDNNFLVVFKTPLFLLMKRTLILTAFLIPSLTIYAEQSDASLAPASMDGKQVYLNLVGAQESTTEMNVRPTEWSESKSTPMVFCFPSGSNNSYSYQLHESSPDAPWPPVVVTYSPQHSAISVTGNDMAVEVKLSFSSSSEGKADIVWHEEGVSWYVRGATFLISDQASSSGTLIMPQASEEDGAIQSVDDGLRELVQQLEQQTYNSAVERLYQKRLLVLLSQMLEGGDVNNVLSNANGTTALHNACGLSCVEIVQWLVDHGADLDAKTAKGASVDACVGGPNAKAIRAILRKARAEYKQK